VLITRVNLQHRFCPDDLCSAAALARALWPLPAVELWPCLVAAIELLILTAADLPRAGWVARWIAFVSRSCLRPSPCGPGLTTRSQRPCSLPAVTMLWEPGSSGFAEGLACGLGGGLLIGGNFPKVPYGR